MNIQRILSFSNEGGNAGALGVGTALRKSAAAAAARACRAGTSMPASLLRSRPQSRRGPVLSDT